MDLFMVSIRARWAVSCIDTRPRAAVLSLQVIVTAVPLIENNHL